MDANEKYLFELESTLDIQKELLARLEKRVVFLSNLEAISEYQENENQILIIKTNAEIGALKHIIKEKHDYFVKYAASMGKAALEFDEKFDAVLEKAKLKASSNPDIESILFGVDIEKIKTHKDSKLFLYNKLLGLLNK